MSRIMRMFVDSAYRNTGKIAEHEAIDFMFKNVDIKTIPTTKDEYINFIKKKVPMYEKNGNYYYFVECK